jgi:hypothetical protein
MPAVTHLMTESLSTYFRIGRLRSASFIWFLQRAEACHPLCVRLSITWLRPSVMEHLGDKVKAAPDSEGFDPW